MNSTPLTTSPRGLALIESFEDFRARRYLCPAGKPTIGFGHVILGSESHPLWDAEITREDATALLRADCRTVEIYLNATTVRPGTSQDQFDALVSLAFNIGVGNFDKSTLRRLFKLGNLTLAVLEFVKWDKVTNPATHLLEPSKGLWARRVKERDLFLGRL